MKRSLTWLLTALITTGLGACASQDGGPTASAMPSASNADALSAYHWQLQDAVDSAGARQAQWMRQADKGQQPMTLTFQDKRLSVTGLCNMLSAGYAVKGEYMNISQVVSTMRMCGDQSLMHYEQRIAQRLPAVSAWTISGADLNNPQQTPTLTLRFENGGKWMLSGKATPETRYGSAGDIVFMEVAAQTVPCNHPLIKDKQCLKTRAVKYDETGLKTGYGPWEVLYDEIEGYQHEAGIRNVLRLKRFTRKHIPADASRYAYVLDMTVESERTTGS